MKSPSEWMQQAIDLAIKNVHQGLGGPFGAVVVRDGVAVGTGANEVTSTNDPTAHAEVVAIRAACRTLGSYQLSDCEIYTSCEPCPMCMGAIYWARFRRFYFACSRVDAALAGFDDALIYQELNLDPKERGIPGVQILRDQSEEAFRVWRDSGSKMPY